MKIMSKHKCQFITAMILLVLCSSAPALVINTPTVWSSRTAIHAQQGGFVEVVTGGSVTANARVDLNGIDAVGTAKLLLNGGDFTSTVDFKHPDDNTGLPCSIEINAGTFTANRIQSFGLSRKASFVIGGGTMIVQTGYNAAGGSPELNPAVWITNGSLYAKAGYKLVVEDLGNGGVKIYGTRAVADPVPADGSTVIDLNLPKLSWTSFDTAIAKVWFGPVDSNSLDYQTELKYIGKTAVMDPNNVNGTLVNFPLTGLTPAVLPLVAPATYTWVVESFTESNGQPDTLIRITVLHFVTSVVPSIKTQPAGQYVFPGETAVFTTVVESLTPLTNFEWFRNGNSKGPGTVENLGNNQYRLTLTIGSTGNQGAYYCIVKNSAGQAQTNTVYLIEKRMLAHWDFNGNLLDTAGTAATPYDGTSNATPTFQTEGSHQGLVFNGTDQYVTLPTGFSNFTAGLTFAVWARMDADAGAWVRYLDLANVSGDPLVVTDSINLARIGTTNDELQFRAGNNVPFNNAIQLGLWQHLVVTMDDTGQVKLYRNGLQFATGVTTMPAVVNRTSNFIGRINPPAAADALFKGMMDDLRVYNYAISADDVADQYSAVAGSFCRTRPGLDWNGNCIVDLEDLATFAASWLECGLWPVSVCPGR